MEQLFSLELAEESVSYLYALIALLKANNPWKIEFGCDSEKTQIRAHFRAADLGPDIFSHPELLLDSAHRSNPSLVSAVRLAIGLRPARVVVEKRLKTSFSRLEINLLTRAVGVLNGRCPKSGLQLSFFVEGGERAPDQERRLFACSGLSP